MQESKHFQIAIDGTAASGKSTVAKLLARKLGISYLDTGKLYRAVALAFLGTSDAEPKGWNDGLAKELLAKVRIELRPCLGKECRVFLQGEDVTEHLAEPKVENSVAYVARLSSVRTWLLGLQQEFASSSSVVLAGRDIGTVVLPKADLKVFMSASPKERARRRLAQQNIELDEEQLKQAELSILKRDSADATRECAPMALADGALTLDSTTLTPEELVAKIVESLRVLIGS